MGACCCCCKKKRSRRSDGNQESEYEPSQEMIELMAKENTVRMINGDLDNTVQSVVQILMEIDEIAAFFMLDK